MSGPFLSFDPLIQTLLAVIALLASTALFLYFELRNRRRFVAWRMVAVIIMMAAVAALVLRPALTTNQLKGVIVLTPNYDAGKVDSVLDIHPGLEILVAEGADPYPGSALMASVQDLTDVRNEIAFVFGDGLNNEALDILDTAAFHFIASAYPEGIIQLLLPKTIYVNRTHFVEGVIKCTSETRLILSGPGGKEDSVRIAGAGVHPFRLSFTPKQSGHFLYELSIGNRKEELPISATEELALNILMLADYPTFEGRQLKNFLSGKHHLLMRYRVSRDKFRYEYINRQAQPLGRLTQNNLSTFDLLILDSDALQKLSPKEKEDLRESVNDGLGLIVLFNEDPAASKMLEGFLPVDFKRYSRDTAQVTLNGSVRTLPAWTAAPQETTGFQSLLRTRDRILSGYTSSGFGKIGFQFLQETYRLALQGDSLAYGSVWSILIGQTARSESKSLDISCRTPFPRFRNTPITIDIISGGVIPELYYDDTRIPLAEDVNIDDIWTGGLWAADHGWHRLKSGKDSAQFYLYISQEGSWPDLSAANAINENSLRSEDDSKILTAKTVRVPVPVWIFYLMFLLSAGFLWISPKL